VKAYNNVFNVCTVIPLYFFVYFWYWFFVCLFLLSTLRHKMVSVVMK